MAYKTETIEKEKVELIRPKLFKVIMHNDNYTTMEFVVEVLISIFHKNGVEAESIMRDVHEKGRGIVGVYPYDIAATKIVVVEQKAHENGFPLKLTMEAE